jgi:vitamin B12 transporter
MDVTLTMIAYTRAITRFDLIQAFYSFFTDPLKNLVMKKERKVWAITLIAVWLLAPNKTIAQQDSLALSNLDEVVITATKFPKNQSETGKVLTVIDEEQLGRSAGKDLAQLLNEQVGVVITGANSNTGKDKAVYLRGAKNEYTLILLDGIPVTDPSGIGGGAFDLRMIPIDQVERIEILKGSQSTLYGTDAIAGVINIITKKKGDKRFGATALLSYGSYNTMKANVNVSGSTNIFDYNVGQTYFKTDGISEAKEESGNGNFDKDGYDQNSIQANFGIRPVKNITLRPFVRYSTFDGKYDGGAFLDEKNSTYASKLFNTGLNGQFAFSKGALNIQYAHDRITRAYTQPDFVDPSLLGTTDYKGSFDNAEVFVNYNLAEHFQVLGGVNYQNQKMNIAGSDALSKSHLNTVSPYVSFFINNLQGFSAELGARSVYHSEFGNTFIYSINPSYLINRHVKLFANYSTGFKAPVIDQLYNINYGNKSLKPEESKSLEGGIQYFTADNKLNLRGTVFSRKIDDVIIYTSPAGYVNFDKQDDIGFELESEVSITDKINVKAFYAFVDGEVKTRNTAERDTTYNNLIRRPKHSIGINVSCAITNQFFVSANFKTFSKRNDLYFNMNTFNNDLVSMDAYQLLDVYAEYKFLAGKLKVFADVRNILDKDYYETYGYTTMGINGNIGVSFSL